jgi:hypothetical protein
MIYAIDFDGLLCENAWPDIGQPRLGVIEWVKQLKADGHKLILWTCRGDQKLIEAVRWCAEQGIVFDAVNDNLPELKEQYGNNCRKVGADWYVDDKNLTLSDIRNRFFLNSIGLSPELLATQATNRL